MSGVERPFSELRETGLLWLINRVVFHPRGYALALVVEVDGSVVGWSLLGDGSEPFWFDTGDDAASFAAVQRLFEPSASPLVGPVAVPPAPVVGAVDAATGDVEDVRVLQPALDMDGGVHVLTRLDGGLVERSVWVWPPASP